jgi:hypothetical protein
MKDQLRILFRQVLNSLEQLPLITAIPLRARSQVIIGSFISSSVLLIACAFWGGHNRGLAGAIVGAFSGAILGLLLGYLVGRAYARTQVTPEGSGKLEIQLDQSNSRYLLGDSVSGQVRLRSFIPLKSKGGTITLTCQGTFSYAPPQDTGQGGKLERETYQIYLQDADVIPPGNQRRGSVQGYAFSLVLPQVGLPTHHGYLCIIQWTLHAMLNLENEQPLEVTQELLVESQPVAMPPEPEYRQTTESKSTELSLVLPRVVYAEGEAVSGQVLLIPKKQVKARKMRIVLLRVENTLRGDNRALYISEWDADKGVFRAQRMPDADGTTYVWLEGEESLCSEVSFRPNETAFFPFSVQIPCEWRPSFQAELGSTTWRLGVSLVIESEPEQHIFHELNIHTCVAKISQLT